MQGAFLHYEVLGPRATVDRWLALLQDTGRCHFVDALHGLEGTAGVSRPAPTSEELQAAFIRGDALRSLRAVERVLPPSRPGGERPDWHLDEGRRDAADLAALHGEVGERSARLQQALAQVAEADAEARDADAATAALRALTDGGHATCPDAPAYAFARKPGWPWRRACRRLKQGGVAWLRGRTGDQVAVVLAAPAGAAEDAALSDTARDRGDDLLRQHGARPLPLPADWQGTSVEALMGRAAEATAQAASHGAARRGALRMAVEADGARCRMLLDSLEEAEARARVRTTLASTRHVAAARVYVRREDAAAVRDALAQAPAEGLVLRRLAPRTDAPTLARRVAASPLGALDGLHPRRFGDMPLASLLALFAPIAAGAVLADVLGGLLLMGIGALLGLATGAGSPRRDLALFAQVAGLVALVLGIVGGRAFGVAGLAWFGETWGASPGSTLRAGLGGGAGSAFVALAFLLGWVALALGVYGLVLAGRAWRRERVARSRALCLGALHPLVVTGGMAALLPSGHGAGFLVGLLPVGLVAVLLLAGPRHLLVGLGLDLVGVGRLVAVGGASLLLMDACFAAWLDAGFWTPVVTGAGLVVACLALVADPAHLAMGLPYDIALGARRVAQPFRPLVRRSHPDARALDAGRSA